MPNYFEFYGLPISLSLDQSKLKKLYYQKSMELHPDRQVDSDMDDSKILELAAVNNLAFKTLKDNQKRLKYILDINNLISENDQLPQSFLMEMMEINEQVMELEFDYSPENYDKIEVEVEHFEESIKVPISDLAQLPELDLDDSTTMDKLKDFHYKSKYLKRIKENLSKIAAQHADN